MFDKDLYDDDYVAAWDDFFERRDSNPSIPSSSRQGVRPDARRAAGIVARKIASARAMMAAFGRPIR